ncbi:hypothetical protein DFH06DRAFT_1147296 [Mycena polygramma]|nr:hypothetical protein DFH06DRAFT_1147296 [Mycena polygramma]
MTPKQLLATCMLSQALHAIVIEFLCYVRQFGLEIEEAGYSSGEDSDSDATMCDAGSASSSDSEADTGPATDDKFVNWGALPVAHSYAGFCDLPPEVALQIVALLGCVEKARLRRTCSAAADLVAESIYRVGGAILQRFGLNVDSVRLLQTITGAAISGSTIAAFLHPTFDVGDLDIVVGLGQAGVIANYIARSVDYTTATPGIHFERMPAVYSVLSFLLANGLRINVVESVTTNPLDCIGYFQMSCLYGAWFAGGFWHAYARLTESGVAVATPSRLSVEETGYRRKRLWQLVLQYVDRGFKISLDELPRPHTCGSEFDCPATVRTSNDGGCTYSPFAPWPYSHDEVVHPTSHWSMHGSGCSQGVLSRYGVVDSSAGLYDRELYYPLLYVFHVDASLDRRWHRAMTWFISSHVASA